MFISGLILLISLVVLIKSSEYVIKYSIRLSYLTGIGKITIGFLLIAFATALPDISIAFLSGFSNNGILSIGNIFGSHILKMCLILGAIAIVVSIKMSKHDNEELLKTIAITSTIPVLLIILGGTSFIFGILCLIIFILFFAYIYSRNRAPKERNRNLKYHGLKTIGIIKNLVYFAISITFVIISAYFVTNSAIEIAEVFNVGKTIIGATIVAIGTSLPELAVSLTAIHKKNISIALGDLMGSTVINMTLVLGVTSLLGNIPISQIIVFLTTFLILTNMILLFMSSNSKIGKSEGMVLISLFIIFLILLFEYQLFFI